MQLSRKLKIVNDHETNPGTDGQIEPSCNLDPTTKPTGFVQLLRRIEKERKARVARKISQDLATNLGFRDILLLQLHSSTHLWIDFHWSRN